MRNFSQNYYTKPFIFGKTSPLKYISSGSNKIIKRLTVLQSKSRERKKQQCFVIEGNRELSRAMEMGYSLETIFYREDTGIELIDKDFDACYEVSAKLFDRISIRSGSEEVLAIVKTINHGLENLDINLKSKILVLESPEKPGNIGPILRTAAAAGVDAVIIADPKTDLYHPNIIRNSLGGVFSIPVAMETSHNVISFLKKNNFNIIATALINKAKHYKRVKYEKPFALVFGSEEKGLDNIWIKIANQVVKIPVKFPIDSLNLSVSAGVLIYHCVES